MIINYYGEGCFRLQSGEVSLLINPINNRLKADVTIYTELPMTSYKEHDGGLFTANEISFPGEYEVKEIEITGMPAPQASDEKTIRTAYSVLWEEINFAILGRGINTLDAVTFEKLGEPDVVFLTVEGEGAFLPEYAAKVVKQLEPSFVIPSFHKAPAEFLKAMGQKPEMQEKLVFKKKELATEKGRVVLLESKG